MWRDNLPSCMRPVKLNSTNFYACRRLHYCRNSNNTINKSNRAPAVSTSCSISFETEKWRPSSKLYWCPREYGYCVRGGGSGCYGNTRPHLNGAVRVSNAMLLVKRLNHRPRAQLYKHANQLTPRSIVDLKKLMVAQLIKKFLTVYGIRRFLTVSARARHQTIFSQLNLVQIVTAYCFNIHFNITLQPTPMSPE
jgi:hypothetical protein